MTKKHNHQLREAWGEIPLAYTRHLTLATIIPYK